MKNDKLVAALEYEKFGFSIIPTGQNKKPVIKEWKQYQTRRATVEEINNWWHEYPNANPTVITGAISGIVVLDFDKKHNRSSKEFSLPVTPCSRTGSGGEHFYFKHPGGLVKNGAGIINGPGVDIRGDGGYVLLPPSVNNVGKYEWIISPVEEKFADIPDWFLNATTENKSEKMWEKGKNGVAEGVRNKMAASMSGKIISSIDPKLVEELGWEYLKIWNTKNDPPLHEKELRIAWESIKRIHQKNKSSESKETQTELILKIIISNPEITLFHTDKNEPYLRFPVDDHKEYWPTKNKVVKRWISREFYKKYKKVPNNDAMSNALNLVDGKACFEGPEHKLENRVAFLDGEIWYDLSNKRWEAVKINDKGWSIVKDPPVLFQRFSHQRPQLYPIEGGNIKEIFEFVNVRKEDRLLYECSLPTYGIPEIAHPAMYLYGPQGSAKTTASRVSKTVFDPSLIDGTGLAKDIKGLIQQISHNYFLVFDNIGYISKEHSDLLCTTITGAGFSKRELFTDDDDIIYNFKRCMAINGINLLALKPDLLERCILFELERVPNNKRKQEKELTDKFNERLPYIFGAILTAISKAMVIKPDIKLKNLPRMADFAVWGCAVAEVLGYSKSKFLQAYEKNRRKQLEQIVDENILVSVLIAFMINETERAISATELLKELRVIAGDDGKTALPKEANILSRRLNELKVVLEEVGIVIDKDRESGERKLIIRKIKENTVMIDQSYIDSAKAEETFKNF